MPTCPGWRAIGLAAAGVRRVERRPLVHGDRQLARFFSFRRDGVTGRMAAAIWITLPI